MRPSEKSLTKIKKEIYKNAVRLFIDACNLYKLKSFPTAYALGILSLEELGKLELVDHVCDDILICEKGQEQRHLKDLFSRELFMSHKVKQMWGSGAMAWEASPARVKKVREGRLDRSKQDAIYVGYYKNKIKSPMDIGSKKAYSELNLVFLRFKSAGDIGFNGFDCFSTSKTRKETKYYYNKIENIFDQIKPPVGVKPNKRLKLTAPSVTFLRFMK